MVCHVKVYTVVTECACWNSQGITVCKDAWNGVAYISKLHSYLFLLLSRHSASIAVSIFQKGDATTMHAGDMNTCYTPCMAFELSAKMGIEDVWSVLTPRMWLAMLSPPPCFHYCITIKVQLQCLQKQADKCNARRNRQIAALPGKGQATAMLAETGKQLQCQERGSSRIACKSRQTTATPAKTCKQPQCLQKQATALPGEMGTELISAHVQKALDSSCGQQAPVSQSFGQDASFWLYGLVSNSCEQESVKRPTPILAQLPQRLTNFAYVACKLYFDQAATACGTAHASCTLAQAATA